MMDVFQGTAALFEFVQIALTLFLKEFLLEFHSKTCERFKK
jgi:hypothetical protein